MKEYKVITWKMGMTKDEIRLEETLNLYAREGWVVTHISEHSTRIVFERDKNR